MKNQFVSTLPAKGSMILKNITKNQSGSAIPFIAIGIFAMVSATGAAIDMGRVQLAQSKMSNALDNAGLAAAASANTTNVNSEAQKYFTANFPTGYMGTTVTTPTVTPSSDGSTYALSVSGTVPTMFMGVIGINSMSISAQSEVTRASKGLEVILVLDNTGSMTSSAGGGVSKITAAKNAATSLVNVLFGSSETIPNLWVGLVPFSQAVNIGTTRGSWTASTAFNWGTTSWGGCVESRSNGTATPQYDITDDTPTTRLFPKYYSPDKSNNDWISSTGTYSINSSKGPNVNCSKPITPMTGSKTTILSGINAMNAVGNTHIDLGLAWGWRMISPKWRGLWGGEMDTASLPLDYNTPLMSKAIILMTDGDNTISSSSYSAYYPAATQLGANPSAELNARTITVCNNIKANNIIVYTIAFGTGITSEAQTILSNCASKPEYYFNSPTTTDLQTAFNKIGDSLANLRISK